jgi:hypothetical protein
MWTVVMILPVLIVYFRKSNPSISAALLLVLYPAANSFMARHMSFWISPYVIMFSIITSYIFYMILTSGFGVKNENALSFAPLGMFIFVLGFMSTQVDMYGPNVAST